MLTIVIRSLIILIFLVVGLRFMGKRTIGEFQPFEFVIVLAVAELAATPMQDLSTPILYGIIPLITIFITHYIVTTLCTKSIRWRKFMNGCPMIIIDENGINNEALKKLNLDVNDLMEMIREQGYFSVEEISFAIIETNGKLSVMPNTLVEAPSSIPMSLIVEGKIMGKNINGLDIDKENILDIIKQKGLNVNDILLMTVESKKVFIQPQNAKYLTFEVDSEV